MIYGNLIRYNPFLIQPRSLNLFTYQHLINTFITFSKGNLITVGMKILKKKVHSFNTKASFLYTMHEERGTYFDEEVISFPGCQTRLQRKHPKEAAQNSISQRSKQRKS